MSSFTINHYSWELSENQCWSDKDKLDAVRELLKGYKSIARLSGGKTPRPLLVEDEQQREIIKNQLSGLSKRDKTGTARNFIILVLGKATPWSEAQNNQALKTLEFKLKANQKFYPMLSWAAFQPDMFALSLDLDQIWHTNWLEFTTDALQPIPKPLANIFDDNRAQQTGTDAQEVWVHKNVIKEINKLSPDRKKRLELLLNNSCNRIWLDCHRHPWPNTDIIPIKQGNTPERIAGFFQDGIFYVPLAYDNHDEYERDLATHTVREFTNKLSEFQQWHFDTPFDTA